MPQKNDQQGVIIEEEFLPKKSIQEILADFLEEKTLSFHDQNIEKAKQQMKEACFAFSSTLALQKKLLEVYQALLKKRSS